MALREGTGVSYGYLRKISLGDSLQNLEKPSRSILRIVVVDNKPCLIKKVSKTEAEVLYREIKDGNFPSKGYLTLKNYCLESERIQSKGIDNSQEFGGKWDNELNSIGIK